MSSRGRFKGDLAISYFPTRQLGLLDFMMKSTLPPAAPPSQLSVRKVKFKMSDKKCHYNTLDENASKEASQCQIEI